MTDSGGTTSANAAPPWRVQISLDAGDCLSIAEGKFVSGLDAKVWMCEQLNLIRFNDRHLRAGGGYSYSGTAEADHDTWHARLIDARTRIVWDSASTGGRRG